MSRIGRAIKEFSLLEAGDKVLLGLSGGKDSLLLLDMLAKRSREGKPKFSLEAVHIRMDNVHYESDTAYLEDFCRQRGVRLSTITTSFQTDTKARRSPCFLCSWNRRKQLFIKAQELGCNKIALGHHRDDIITTTLLNLLYQGTFSTMPARLEMRKMPLTIIRPLCMVEEADIKRLSELAKWRKQVKLCPFEKESQREKMTKLFQEIEQENKEARYSVFNALGKEGKLVE